MSESTLVRAPSNIALVKYMGKQPGSENLPDNPSVSLTLDRLATWVELSFADSAALSDSYVAVAPEGAEGRAPDLNEAGTKKFLAHLARFKQEARAIGERHEIEFRDLARPVVVKSTNTFPHSAGIASSASSFAALSLASFLHFARDRAAFFRRWEVDVNLRETVAEFSRRGSGSSCRSLQGPWVSWEGAYARKLYSKMPALVDLVLIAGEQPKTVGSSEAHARVKSSPRWPGRVSRAESRHREAVRAIEEGDFEKVARLSDEDFRDMHELFHTSEPSFTYWNEDTKMLLAYFAEHAPGRFILTMDAGPNLHLIVPDSESFAWEEKLESRFPGMRILRDSQGKGAEIRRGVENV